METPSQAEELSSAVLIPAPVYINLDTRIKFHKTVSDYCARHGEPLLGMVDIRTERPFIRHDGTKYRGVILPGYYYMTNEAGYVIDVSHQPTAHSAINMLKRHERTGGKANARSKV